jgi:hypothetical protein
MPLNLAPMPGRRTDKKPTTELEWNHPRISPFNPSKILSNMRLRYENDYRNRLMH